MHGIGGLLAAASWFAPTLTTRGAAAHTVGFSQSEFTVNAETGNVHAILVFAKRDAVHLGNIDADQDGQVSPRELQAAQATFRALLSRSVVVHADASLCPLTLEGGGDVSQDGFGLAVSFACKDHAKTVGIAMPLLRELSEGHRHALRITLREDSAAPENTAVTGETVLSAHDFSIAIALTPNAAQTSQELTLTRSAGVAQQPAPSAFAATFRLGIEHILHGWDHLLFLFALLLSTRNARHAVAAVSAFSVAHSVTLAVAALGVWTPSARLVEPAIAASIAVVALDNVRRDTPPHRWIATFVFGLIHGFGFASALAELAVQRARLLPTLLGFNLGVEVGQLAVVVLTLPLLLQFRARVQNATTWVRRASGIVAVVGVVLCVVRVLHR